MMTIIDEVLNLFPAHIHPLILVSDPDRLLAGEAVMTELAQRGFGVIQEKDAVLLRQRVEEARPFTTQHPLLVITPGALEDLPYDLYQPAYLLKLSLHQYFPNLAYPVLQSLSPEQVEKLGSCPPPVEILSRQKTMDYLLREVFNADAAALSQAHALIAWLNDYHQRRSILADVLRAGLVERLKRYPAYREWEIERLISEGQAFSDFIQEQWQDTVQQTLTGKPIQEAAESYHLIFERNAQLQDLVPALVRQGSLRPIEMPDKKGLPAWTHPGITLKDARLQRLTALLEELEGRVRMIMANLEVKTGWTEWQGFARDWAELSRLRYESGLEISDTQKGVLRRLATGLDEVFAAWLQKNYASSGAQRLPMPHHVHHIPHYLAHLRNLGQVERIALIILDGLSLSDWQVIQAVWNKRHADWAFKSDILLAQIPTITAISRYALVSGLRPADFASDLEHCPPEARAWELFWSREGAAEAACGLMALAFDRGIDQMPELADPRVKLWCLIDDTPDKLAHNAVLGAAEQQSSLRLWLDPAHAQNSAALESSIADFLGRGFGVFIASDHGHVEATGFGQPSEGLLAQTRGKRARIYSDRLAALRVKDAFPETILWEKDGLLPERMAALMPAGRKAFAPNGERVVTHGGISIEEAIVPLIQISKASA